MQTLRSREYCARFVLLTVGVLIGCAINAADADAQSTETFQVNNLLDSGPGSLRAAIDDANASTADTKTITFDVIANQSINLNSPLPDIDDGVTIDGSTATNLTIDGDGEARIFRVEAGTTTVRDLGLDGAQLEIGSGASLSFDVSADQEVDEVITDEGRLVKDGEATLTLRGANDYSGGTLVSKGTLLGDTTSLQGNITNNATVVFDQDTNGTYADVISGTGSVQKTDSGTVTFSGTNTYKGGTTISEGALSGDTTSLQGNIAVESNGTVIFDQAANDEYEGNLTGSGDFTKLSAGTLTLSGDNTISGQTSLVGGALRGDFSSIPEKIEASSGTQVIFDHASDGSYSGEISGAGMVTKTNTGSLTFSGFNSYTGGTTVNGGTLRSIPENLPNRVTSSIVNNAELILDAGGTHIYRGAISGTGNLTKIGGGTLTMIGTHTFTGLTSITSGRLNVDASGSIASGVDVGSSAVLGGTGSIGGPVTVNGTVAPGDSIGTLSVDSITFAAGSVFEVEVDESGTSDRLAVTNGADLAGGSVQVDPGAGNYLVPVDVTILTTGVDLSTEFASLGPDFAFLDITLDTNARSVMLSIVRNAMGLGEFAQTPNQSTIAAALEAALAAGTPPDDIFSVFQSLNVLTADQVPSVLDSMTGETLSQFATTRLATAERFGRALGARVLDHQWANSGAFITAGTGAGEASHRSADSVRPENSPVFGVAMLGVGPMGAPGVEAEAATDSWIRTWIDGSAIYGDVDGNGDESDFDYNIWGGSLGADLRLAEHWILGLAGGYAATSLDFSSRPGDGDVDTYQGAVYGGYVDPRFYLGASGRYAYNEMDGKREIRFGAINRTARADLDGHDYGARLEGGLNLIEIGPVVFQPTASVNYNRLTQDDVTETGATSLNLELEDNDLDSLVTGVGLRVRGRWAIARDLWIVPELRGRWLHEFLDTDRLIEARLVSAPSGSSAFQIQGLELSRDSGSIGLAWSVITNSAWRVIGSYDLALNDELIQHMGSITLSLEW